MFQYLNGAGLKVGLFKPVSSFQTNDHREIQQLTPGQTAVLPVDQVKLFTRVQLDRLVLVDKFKYLNGAGLVVPYFNGNTHAQIKQLTLEQAWVLPVDQVKLLSIPQQDILLTRGMYQYLHGAGLDVSRYGKAIVIDGVTYKFTLTTRQIVQLTGAQVEILRSSGCDMTEIDKILTPIVGLGGNLGNIGNAVDTSNLNFNFGFDMSNILT